MSDDPKINILGEDAENYYVEVMPGNLTATEVNRAQEAQLRRDMERAMRVPYPIRGDTVQTIETYKTRREQMETYLRKKELAERLELSTILYHQYITRDRRNDDDGE